jgi:hypothetical protein
VTEPRAYWFGGERIVSEIELPGLAPADGAGGSIRIRRRRDDDLAPAWISVSDEEVQQDLARIHLRRWIAGDGAWHRVRFGFQGHSAEFVIRGDGEEVSVETAGEVGDAEVASLIEGAILGGAMRLRGSPCLHASVLGEGDRGVALSGPSGAGKSSLALAMMQLGCRLVSDDLAALEVGPRDVRVGCGRMRLRLWPDVARRFDIDEERVDRLYPVVTGLRRLVVSVGPPQACAPAPLAAILLLGPRAPDLADAVVEELPPGASLAALAANLYGLIDPGPSARRRELAALAGVAARVRVCRLTLPDKLDRLPHAAQALRRQFLA